LFYLSCKL